jgi:hypothetical protein
MHVASIPQDLSDCWSKLPSRTEPSDEWIINVQKIPLCAMLELYTKHKNVFFCSLLLKEKKLIARLRVCLKAIQF